MFRSRPAAFVAAALALLSAVPSFAFTPRHVPARFDDRVRTTPGTVIGHGTTAVDALPASDRLRALWSRFAEEQGGTFRVTLDPRSGLPVLASGVGLAWAPAARGATSLDELARRAEQFLDEHRALLGDWSGQLRLDVAASGPFGGDAWQVTFRQVVNGVPVDGARFEFHVAHGNLVSFGATNWAPVTRTTRPVLGEEAARAALYDDLGPDRVGDLVARRAPELLLLPVDPARGDGAAWGGAQGAGYAHLLVWRFVLAVPGEPATWVAEVSADDGAVLGFYDDTRYDRVLGGVYPVSDDQLCPTGCEQPGFPLPFADVTIGGSASTANDAGLFSCTAGQSLATTLAGPYIKVHDLCGAVNETATCGANLDLLQGTGTDCVVPSGHSAGDTHSARSSFYHLNRAMQKGRAWLPDNAWLKSQVTDTINLNATCNAFWDGSSVNFYKSGGGCRNTGEIMGVFVHEWGHGLDQNDGGGMDNPSEAYADVVAFFETRESCVGRGFWGDDHNCSGYGDACLHCSGIRDQDWDVHANHSPATPQGFLANNCGGGGGPCGKEVHCEGYVSAEAVYDLAVRDLPAAGLDTASAWQLAERLFYQSRKGGGGNNYNCALPSSDGCSSGSWFHRMLVADDDDGNLANGTPHAAALFGAFARHGIACGGPSDPANQNHGACPSFVQPFVAAADNGNNSVALSWTAVPGATSYRVLRNDLGCALGQIAIDTVSAPATTYTDADAPSGFAFYYRVQALGSNPVCESAVSDCASSKAMPAAGAVVLDRGVYGCSATVAIEVDDGNAGAGPLAASASSTTEGTAESVPLLLTLTGSGKYRGSIPLTTAVPAADGKLSVKSGDTVTVRYVDANDGAGHTNVPVTTTATVDCVAPVIASVATGATTDTTSSVTWTTDESSDSVVTWGPGKPPTASALGSGSGTAHKGALNGLTACTTYWYKVSSADPAGNRASSDNGGAYYHFETLGNFGRGLQNCHAGQVKIDRAAYACTDTLTFNLADLDLNVNPGAVDTVWVYAASTTDGAGERVLMTETGPNTSYFTGSIALKPGAPAPDGALEVANGDVVTVSYLDANEGTGAGDVSYASAPVDCAGPAITNLRVDTITDARATIRFTTAEPGDTTVEWGTTPALGQTVTSSSLTTDHAVALKGFGTCGTGYFRVRSKDQFGNQSALDRNGTPFRFSTGLIPGLYFKDDFENGNAQGWTLGGEWQIDAPQGKGGSSGAPDPASAYNASGVLGHDLTGLGAHPGDYEGNVSEAAKSPLLDSHAWTHTRMIYYRKLQAGNGDDAKLTVWADGQGSIPWHDNGGVADADWQMIAFDLGTRVDGHATLQFEFRQTTNAPGDYSGFNIDDVILKDGSQPDYDACRNCGGVPSFAGAVSAVDNNPCGASGVTVSWNAAAAPGSGGAVTYAVYRGTAPGFPADAAHRIAAGVGTLSYLDAAAPAGALYYLVRAESNESCGDGPANHGVTDDNAAYVAVTKTTSRPLPGEVTGVGAGLLAKAAVRLTWTAAANATGYDVWRSTSGKPGTFASRGTSAALRYDDAGAGADGTTYYYLVRGSNPCNQEGP